MKEIKTIKSNLSLVSGSSKKTGRPYVAMALTDEDGIKILSFDRYTIMKVFNMTPSEFESLVE